jgi:hypothetical protein
MKIAQNNPGQSSSFTRKYWPLSIREPGFDVASNPFRGTRQRLFRPAICGKTSLGDIEMEKKAEVKQHTQNKEIREPTAAENAAFEKYVARCKATSNVTLKVADNGSVSVENHPHKFVGHVLLSNALGSVDAGFLNGILNQLVGASSHGQKLNEGQLNFMVSVINGIEPRDQLETMLAAQMAAVHIASMKLAPLVANPSSLEELDSAQRAVNKLARTYASQLEALKRHRAGAQHNITLQNVSVAEGGQAIVGNVTPAPRKNGEEKVATSPTSSTATNVVPMPKIDESEERVRASGRRKPAA